MWNPKSTHKIETTQHPIQTTTQTHFQAITPHEFHRHVVQLVGG